MTYKALFWVLCSFHLLEIKAEQKEVFEVKADKLMEIMLDDVYKGYLKKYRNIGRNGTYYSTNSQITKTILVATNKIIQREVHDNLTLEELNIRRLNRTIRKLLEYKINPSPNFQALEDEITIQTRRFNKIKRAANTKSARREHYFSNDERRLIPKEKKKAMGLMQQFIYETHYMLPFMQLIRKKYFASLRYQIGYCFALLRNLKKQQMMIYSTLKRYFDLIMTVYAHLELYQKILRLDVDIKDLLRFLYALDNKKKKYFEKKKNRIESKIYDLD